MPEAIVGGAVVRVSWTGNAPAEIGESVPIVRKAGTAKKVVMSFSSTKDADESMPDLEPGDQLEVSAELEVTTDLTPDELEANGGKGCFSVPYGYAPKLQAELLLTRDPQTVSSAQGKAHRIGEPKTATVRHEQHHWVVVFDRAPLVVPSGWSGTGRINLVLEATSPEAAAGHCLLIGQNEPDGTVGGDMAAISVARFRPAKQATPPWQRTNQIKAKRLPIREDERQWRVIYSMPLTDLVKDEQLRVHAKVAANSQHLGIPARLTTRVFLATAATQAEPDDDYASTVGSSKGKISKANGSNCLPSGMSLPAEKVGVLRVTKSVPKGKTLYVNVSGVGGDPTKRARPGSELQLVGGLLEVQRFAAGVRG